MLGNLPYRFEARSPHSTLLGPCAARLFAFSQAARPCHRSKRAHPAVFPAHIRPAFRMGALAVRLEKTPRKLFRRIEPAGNVGQNPPRRRGVLPSADVLSALRDLDRSDACRPSAATMGRGWRHDYRPRKHIRASAGCCLRWRRGDVQCAARFVARRRKTGGGRESPALSPK
jgi:hypothetical protein